MKLEFRLNLKDYQEANQAHGKSQKLTYFFNWFLSIGLAILGIRYLWLNNWVYGMFDLLLAISINPKIDLYQQLILKQLWQKNNNILKEPISIEITKEFFYIKGISLESTIPWQKLNKYIETANLFLIYEGKLCFIMIPKRAFETEDQQQEFKQILQEKIPLGTTVK